MRETFARKPHGNNNKTQLEEKLAGAHAIDISRELDGGTKAHSLASVDIPSHPMM